WILTRSNVPSDSCSGGRRPSSQTAIIGTKVLERKYEATMANPTAKASGTNKARPTPTMNKDGMNTAKTASMDTKRDAIVSTAESITARAVETVFPRWAWILSMATVEASTSTPTANANPPSVMILMVWPMAHKATTDPNSATGMVRSTIRLLRQLRRKIKTISHVSTDPKAISILSALIVLMTYPD